MDIRGYYENGCEKGEPSFLCLPFVPPVFKVPFMQIKESSSAQHLKKSR